MNLQEVLPRSLEPGTQQVWIHQGGFRVPGSTAPWSEETKWQNKTATGWHILQQGGTYCNRMAHIATGWHILQQGGTYCNRVAHITTGWHTHQQALPIWTPAWPMWMEITSLMVTASLFYFLTSTKVKLSWSSGRALDRQQWVGRAASCGNVLAQCGDERASATVAKESRRGPARLESPGEPGFQQTNHRPECPHVWCIIA